MTKKDRTIKAFDELIRKYREPKGKRFFGTESCPLCLIHFQDGDCYGCPLARRGGGLGCNGFRTFREASSLTGYHYDYPKGKGVLQAFIKRAEFFEKYLPVIKKWPASRFTMKGWRYSGDEISRED